ncbi:hypothetical protein BSKO_10575 [Bryopsis sp. KO-2023]|nr:hypothetical protein BSKO_10575 [Bryopsis sp. KO-2023]
MFASSVPSTALSYRDTGGRYSREEDDLNGTRLLRESDVGCFGFKHRRCLLGFPIKTLMYSENTKLVWWADRGRFVMHDVRSSDTSKTPRNRVRFTVLCVTTSVINGVEFVWTGHRGGELCVWNQRGQLITKPCRVSKSRIRVICIASPETAWVGGDSGNIRVVQLDVKSVPAELKVQTTVVPGLAPVGRITSSSQWVRPVPIMTRPNLIDSVPEEQELQSGGSEPVLVQRSTNSFASRFISGVQNLTFHSRAHRSHVRCIFAKSGRVWTGAGRVFHFGTIKMWNESDKSLMGKFLCESRGPCSCMKSIPWNTAQRSSSRDVESIEDWRLLTAHDSGKILLWDPGYKQLQPLLEIEFRRSPIRACAVFPNLGLLCTCHGDGSVEVARLPTPQMRNLSGSQPVMAEDQLYPFVPRTISECLHPTGLRFAVGGNDCLFTVSNSGRIHYWPKDKLEASLKILRQSSLRRMPVEVVNESVMVIQHDQISSGEVIWEGDFATVKKGKFLAKEVIIKVANENADSSKAMQAIVKDAHILATLRHPNIVNIMAVGDNPPFVVMQYYEEGSLYDVLKRARNNPRVARRLTWERRLEIAIGVGCGMHFLNAQKIPILHRDLKSPNLFVEKDFVSACVGDFNLSKDTPQYANTVASSCKPSNPMWLAPEVVKGRSDFTVAADVYSFGICLWELFTGLTPWEHLKTPGKRISKEAFYGRIRYELYEGHRPRIRRDESGALVDVAGGKFPQAEDFVELIEDCWSDRPEGRPSNFGQIVDRLERIKRKLMESRMSAASNRATESKKVIPKGGGGSSEQEISPPNKEVELLHVRRPLETQENINQQNNVGGPPLPLSPFAVPEPALPEHQQQNVVPGMPRSPFEEPLMPEAEASHQLPPEIPRSPFDMPEGGEGEGAEPSMRNNGEGGGGEMHTSPHIPRSPFEDMENTEPPSVKEGGECIPAEDRLYIPAEIPRSPFDMPDG